jgi:hypothetical protein
MLKRNNTFAVLLLLGCAVVTALSYWARPQPIQLTKLGLMSKAGNTLIHEPYACLTNIRQDLVTVSAIIEWEETYGPWTIERNMDGTVWVQPSFLDVTLNEFLAIKGIADSNCWSAPFDY